MQRGSEAFLSPLCCKGCWIASCSNIFDCSPSWRWASDQKKECVLYYLWHLCCKMEPMLCYMTQSGLTHWNSITCRVGRRTHLKDWDGRRQLCSSGTMELTIARVKLALRRWQISFRGPCETAEWTCSATKSPISSLPQHLFALPNAILTLLLLTWIHSAR